MGELLKSERAELEDAERAERNLEIVQQNLTSYQGEEDEVDRAQRGLDYGGWVKTLSEAAQKVYNDYSENFANKPRSGCDPELLCQLCDRLYDVAAQLRPFVEYSTEVEERGALLMMLDQLRLYHRELGLVREARGEGAQGGDAQGDETVH